MPDDAAHTTFPPARFTAEAEREGRVFRPGQPAAPAYASKPSIAVLPFDNLGSDDATTRLADGIT